jgi:polysaccharide deacetylase 2 family uncharacterized protein YibQ
LRSRVSHRFRALTGWIAAHRWPSIGLALLVLFVVSVVGGYRIAERLDSLDRDRLARDTLEDMKRQAGGGGAAPGQHRQQGQEPGAKYASIDQIPGLSRYMEGEPDQRLPTHEDRVRARPQLAAAAAQSAWRRFAVPFADLNSRPIVAIVIDDVGIDRPHSKRAWELPGPLTLSFLPYARDLREQARAARARGQELMLHMPMEPTGRADPGPGALLVSMSDGEIRQRLGAALDSFDGYVGVNNHMGSRFTANADDMKIVLQLLKGRGLMFLDSRTSPQSVGDQLAQEIGVPSMSRNVFLDDDMSPAAVRRKLAETEEVARRQGFVVAIGHPHEATLQALAEWLPTLSAKGMALAPATAALRKRNGWD